MLGETAYQEYTAWKNPQARKAHQLKLVEFLRSQNVPEFQDFPADFDGHGWYVSDWGSVSWEATDEDGYRVSGSITTGEFGSRVYVGEDEDYKPCLKLHGNVLKLPDGFIWRQD